MGWIGEGMMGVGKLLLPTAAAFFLSSCIPSAAQDQMEQPQKTCENLSHGRYCFDNDHIFSSGDAGFLLFVPMPVADVACNKSREGWPETKILFGDYRMPDRIYPLSGRAARGVVRRVVDPSVHLFKASEYEVETCRSDLAIEGTHCQLASSWNDMQVKISYWKGCGDLKYRLASDVEDFLNKARQGNAN